MIIVFDNNKIPSILKECFLFYSFKIGNYIPTIDGQKKYVFNYTENSSLYNFAKIIKENQQYLNIDWLFAYFNYQFCYWNFIKQEQERKTKKLYLIKLHCILGKKALKRYNEKDSKDSYYYHSSFFPKYNIKKEELLQYLNDKNFLSIEEEKKESNQNSYKLNIREEEIKLKKYNTLEAFSLCLNFTTLFRFNSDLCKKCQFKSKCKKILKLNYKNLYQKRLIQQLKYQNEKE